MPPPNPDNNPAFGKAFASRQPSAWSVFHLFYRYWARLAFFQAIGMHKPKPLALWEENL
jgi:hypothetical protein